MNLIINKSKNEYKNEKGRLTFLGHLVRVRFFIFFFIFVLGLTLIVLKGQ